VYVVLATLKASSGKQAFFVEGGRCLGDRCLGGVPLAAAMAAMADDMVVKAGPFDMPKDGQNGTLAWAERQEILGLTGVSAAVRDRKNTHGKRHLTLSGPMSGMELAKKMAWQYIVNSQRRQEDFKETPGSEKDWVATERNQKRQPAASSSSSSWQPMSMQAAMMQPMHVMPMQGMMHHAMMQAYLQPMMHGMLQQQHAMMQPMFVRQGGINEVEQSELEQSEADDDEDVEVIGAEIDEVKTTPKRLAAPPIAPTAPMPASKVLLAATSKSRGTTPRRPLPAKAAPLPPPPIPAKAAPLPLRLAGLKKELMELGLSTAAKTAVHPAKPYEVDDDEDAEEIYEGPVSNSAILASRRTVESNKKRKLVSVRLDPTIQYVNIMSVGWRQQGVPYTQNFKELIEGKQGLIWRLKVRGLPEPDVVVDCRPLKRYDFDKAILKHTGHNAAIVHQTVDHRLFKPTMKAALDNIREVFDEGNGANVLVVCTSGCHRSVSMALVMEYILKKMLYHTNVRHLSEGSWKPRRLCMSCTECADDNEAKLKSFEVALRMVEEW
jgi:hypothetical protein